MASRYWVGGGSSTNWNATANTNWAATSGGANNQSVPTTTDDVFFDANSGTGNSVISASLTVKSVNCTGYAGTITHNTGVTLTINTGTATSLLFSAGMTYTPTDNTSLITFTHTSGTADITSNSKRLGGLTINGVGGTTRLLDALRVDIAATSALTLTNGTFNGNTFAVTVSNFASSNSNTRTLTLGNGTWTIGPLQTAGTVWNLGTITNLTFNKGTSNIVIQSSSAAGSRVFSAGTLTYNNLTINANTGRGVVSLTGTTTYATVAVAEGNTLMLPASATTTMTALSVTGTAALQVALHSNTPGTVATLSCSGTVTAAWAAIRDITGSGGGSFTGTNSFNLGATSGWAITEPSDASVSAPSVAQIVAGVWDEPTAGNVTAGTFGAQLKTVLDAVDAKTTNLPSDPADASVIAARFDTLDTAVDALPTNAELATALGTADDAVLTAIDALPTANENADALLDRAAGVETGLTVRQAFRLFAAALLGKASGLATTTAVFRDTGDSKDRITATVDADGNRSAVTLDAS